MKEYKVLSIIFKIMIIAVAICLIFAAYQGFETAKYNRYEKELHKQIDNNQFDFGYVVIQRDNADILFGGTLKECKDYREFCKDTTFIMPENGDFESCF